MSKRKATSAKRGGGSLERAVRRQDVINAINSAPELPEKLSDAQITGLMRCCMEGAASVDYMLRIAEKKMKIEIRNRVEALYAS
jgi:hypothetical protein